MRTKLEFTPWLGLVACPCPTCSGDRWTGTLPVHLHTAVLTFRRRERPCTCALIVHFRVIFTNIWRKLWASQSFAMSPSFTNKRRRKRLTAVMRPRTSMKCSQWLICWCVNAAHPGLRPTTVRIWTRSWWILHVFTTRRSTCCIFC